MLHVIAYDITHPRRLRRVAQVCLDFGVRLQKSIFECWLDDDRFQELWSRLSEEIDSKTDFVVAYTLDERASHARQALGSRKVSEKKTSYIL